MIAEDFHHQPKSSVEDVSAKLFACCYEQPPSFNANADMPVKAETPKKSEQAEKTETREQAADRKIKEHFGADVLEHLNDWDWLIDNRKKLEAGFSKLKGQDAWDVAQRMKEQSVVDGKPLIYLEKLDSNTSGNLIPKRYDIYLRRGSLRNDNRLGQLYH